MWPYRFCLSHLIYQKWLPPFALLGKFQTLPKFVSRHTWLSNYSKNNAQKNKLRRSQFSKKRVGGGSSKVWSWSQVQLFFFTPSLSFCRNCDSSSLYFDGRNRVVLCIGFLEEWEVDRSLYGWRTHMSPLFTFFMQDADKTPCTTPSTTKAP